MMGVAGSRYGSACCSVVVIGSLLGKGGDVLMPWTNTEHACQSPGQDTVWYSISVEHAITEPSVLVVYIYG